MTTTTTYEPPTASLLAALRRNLQVLGELALRYEVETQPPGAPADWPTISCPADVQQLVGPELAPLVQEQLRVLLLNTKHRVIGQRVIYQGNVSAACIRVAEVFRPAIVAAAPGLIVVHNHPSGDPTPSPVDVAVTKELVAAAQLLDIELLDHIVIGGDRAVSLREQGLLPS